MKKKYSQTYFQNIKRYNIFENYSVDVEIEENVFDISPDILFSMAGRKNLKRGFLFVSKVLGKHLAIIPGISVLFGMLLGSRYFNLISSERIPYEKEILKIIDKFSNMDINESIFSNILDIKDIQNLSTEALNLYNVISKDRVKLKDKTLFIGFAETATALGHSVYELFDGDIGYIHTTREYLSNLETSIFFQEEHSHATEHFIYADISNYDKIVFIDDEVTTGNTVLNFIREIRAQTGIDRFAVLSILDWRKDKNFAKFSVENGIEIDVLNLIKGKIQVNGDLKNISFPTVEDVKEVINGSCKITKVVFDSSQFQIKKYYSVDSDKIINTNGYLEETGRFLITPRMKSDIEIGVEGIREILEENDKNEPILFLGTGEFMYIPMRIAMYFENAFYHSTTRSPIYSMDKSNYGVRTEICFDNPYDKTIKNYFYNIKPDFYKKMFIFFERDCEEENMRSMVEAIQRLKIPEVFIIVFVNN